MSSGALPPLDPLEVCTGMVWGPRRGPSRPRVEADGSPAEVLERVLVEALEQPPCFVLFSGGRDSSLVLAAAVRAARRHGLQDPIALTSVSDDLPETGEREWQAALLRHVGLDNQIVFADGDDLDLLGPLATGVLERHGGYWPPLAHSMSAFARQAGSGTLVTGGGGDEIFTPWAWRRAPVRELLALRRVRRIVKWGGYYALPLWARQRLLTERFSIHLSWLRPEALVAFNRSVDDSEPPVGSWLAELERFIDGRYLEMVRATLSTLAADAGVGLVEPLYDPRMIRAVGRSGPAGGYPTRTEALQALFPGYLPDEIFRRSTKAEFTRTFWGPRARAFAEDWDGSGLDESVVDPAALREQWRRERPDGRTFGLLHQLWLDAR